MARILFAWEMGAGLGHLLPHRPVFAELVARGYEVHVAARELAQVRRAFGELPLVYWQSPLHPGNAEPKILPTASPVHILHNVGYGDADKVIGSLAAWKNLLRRIEPNLLLVNYCRGVLLAGKRTQPRFSRRVLRIFGRGKVYAP